MTIISQMLERNREIILVTVFFIALKMGIWYIFIGEVSLPVGLLEAFNNHFDDC